MPVTSDFDRFFLHLPPLNREKDFDEFWKTSISDLRKVPIEPLYRQKKGFFSANDTFEVSFRGFGRSPVRGELRVPKRKNRPRVVMLIPDYNRRNGYLQYPADTDLAFFSLQLRGHRDVDPELVEEAGSPGFMVEHIDEPGSYYLAGVYLDALRAIDALRLNKEIDCSAMGVIGKGLGAAAALFSAAFSPRVTALVLDTPSFCHLELSQNISTGDMAGEINEYLALHKTRKKQVKRNLSYFDAINFSDRIKVPTLVTVGFKDTISPPQCVFALFNRLLCEKTMEVYPDHGNEAGEEKQFRKSLDWIRENLSAQEL